MIMPRLDSQNMEEMSCGKVEMTQANQTHPYVEGKWALALCGQTDHTTQLDGHLLSEKRIICSFRNLHDAILSH